MILGKALCHTTHMQALGALVPLMRARTEIMPKTDILTTLCGRNPVLAQRCWHGDPASLFTLLARWRRRRRREIGKHCCTLTTLCLLGLSLLALWLPLIPGLGVPVSCDMACRHRTATPCSGLRSRQARVTGAKPGKGSLCNSRKSKLRNSLPPRAHKQPHVTHVCARH